mmetsp:Transcript_26696/g.64049  ORF Transcript_26696/g.64049 Transcript_26696/m.64049 type:complete len:272 (+) Transcript_26696:317-1132(+)|eukprot:CAMPEP_0181135496 /NCGR_PEP_ID=MMETSP1071-20121207/32670_1 /TAXON_ID=35127 /ORGANISM="Thalassiosira sp., Strain NH16" /LENGTH=271 /DNA_ID=CAMNT_0023222121 /DNA_START=241 /DNA_END=1056 /DNA_ORIENTATION=-
MPSLINIFGGSAAAIAIKLTSSIDDVLWLSAFLIPSLSPRQRFQNALTYACVCLLQTVLAFFISTFGEKAVEKITEQLGIHMSVDRILTLIAGAILLVYSIVLGVEYYKENYGEDEKGEYDAIELSELEEGSEGEMQVAGQASGETTTCTEEDEENEDITETAIATNEAITEDDDPSPPLSSDKKSGSLALIAFIGSLDDLTLFVPMLVGKAFGILELIIGATIATLMIIAICLLVTKCQIVADALERVPLVAIVLVFTAVLLTKGIIFMD